ncbi:MAG TPA: class I SAM-dependent methyltransferase [Actinoplanes sp.]|jgi:demethylmenaquinone methyltransferase/2-methoxy-6-polyprenyl-1,4-benzoquinol methylase
MDQLAEQREYYRQRAPEYDEWWQSRGQYARTPEQHRRWAEDVQEAEHALDAFAPTGDVLEYAAGTGWWTERLARHATRLTAVDAADEALEVNRRRTGDADRITYLRADIFDWSPPPAAFDVVFFGYWLSHVPEDRLASFWQHVATALRPGGRVFLLDSYRDIRLPDDVQPRVLNDGRRFQVIKRYWQPDELTGYTADLGWRLTASVTAHGAILYAHGAR